MNGYDFRVISADSHVDEPIDEWVSRLPEELLPVARRLVEIDGQQYIVNEGLAPIRKQWSDREFGSDVFSEEELEREFRADETGGRDLEKRIKLIESDGVWGEVIFPNRYLALGAHPNPRYQEIMARYYNDMVAEVFLGMPDRFAPVALLPSVVPADAAAEARRCRELGFRTVMLPPVVPWLPYWHTEWDVVWSMVEELEMPVNFHVFSGNLAQGTDFGNLWIIPDELVESGREIFRGEREEEHLATTAMGMAAGMSPMMHLIGSGTLDRHPRLRFVLTEAEAGWIPWALQALDTMQRRRRFGRVSLELRPSEYFHRQGWATFLEDSVAIELLERIGADRLMWSNDYPHDEGTYHESGAIIQRLIGHLPSQVQKQLLHDTAAQLYGLDGASLAPPGVPLGAGSWEGGS
jgi:predicted TIM-barrel fold metal-dependent hydrolase